MDRKAMAQETLEIMRQGYYELPVKREYEQKPDIKRITIKEAMEQSVGRSMLISPAEGEKILDKYSVCAGCSQPETRVDNISTVEAVRMLAAEGKTDIGVLNFASAKNPGGGFLNGAQAQEESLTVSSTLYPTLTAHEEYYKENRAHSSMMYLDYGIYSPEVVFFREYGAGAFEGGKCGGSQESYAPQNEAGPGNLCGAEGKASGAWRLWMRRIPKRSRGGSSLVERTFGGGNGTIL